MTRVSNQNGISWLHNIVEINHSGQKPSNWLRFSKAKYPTTFHISEPDIKTHHHKHKHNTHAHANTHTQPDQVSKPPHSLCYTLKISDHDGVSLLYIMLEIHHSGQEPSTWTFCTAGKGCNTASHLPPRAAASSFCPADCGSGGWSDAAGCPAGPGARPAARRTALGCGYVSRSPSLGDLHTRSIVVCWLLNVPATCECISGTDLLRQFYVLPHWDRSCRSNFPSHPVTVYWHRANQSQWWPYNARRLAG